MVWSLRAAVAITSVISGYLHYDLWANHGYRNAPVKEMFLLQAVAAVVAGLAALAPWRWAPLGAVAVSAASLVAFVLSRTSGVPTLNGSFTESGLRPSGATFLGLSTTLVILIVQVVAVAVGALLVARPDLVERADAT